MPRPRPPPDRCPAVERDLRLLRELSESAALVRYLGTVASDTDYRDIYLVLTRDRLLHVIAVRRLCPEAERGGGPGQVGEAGQ